MMPDIEHVFTPPFHLVILTPMVTPQVFIQTEDRPTNRKTAEN